MLDTVTAIALQFSTTYFTKLCFYCIFFEDRIFPLFDLIINSTSNKKFFQQKRG